MEMQISEKIQTAVALAVTSLGIATPSESARIEMKDSHKLRFILGLAAGAGATASIVIKEHDAAAAGNTNVLTTSVPSYVKLPDVAATEIDASVSPIVDTAVGANSGLYLLEIDPLDLTDGFKYISVEVTSAAARNIFILAELDAVYKPAHELVI